MRTVRFHELVAQIDARKAELGIAETPADVEALRNKGGRRTPEKRELLRRVAERARLAGKLPVPGYW
jgi:hypothetical protein